MRVKDTTAEADITLTQGSILPRIGDKSQRGHPCLDDDQSGNFESPVMSCSLSSGEIGVI